MKCQQKKLCNVYAPPPKKKKIKLWATTVRYEWFAVIDKYLTSFPTSIRSIYFLFRAKLIVKNKNNNVNNKLRTKTRILLLLICGY